MFAFRDPQYLYLLFIIPILAIVHVMMTWRDVHRMKLLGEKELLAPLMPLRSKVRRHVKFAVALMALSLVILMLARPQYGLKQRQETNSGIEAVVMIDVSNSMLAKDVQPNRLERAKLLITNIIERMKNDRVALGVFAGEAYPQLPITSDYASAKLFLDALSTEMVTLQGTNIGAAIELAGQSFTDKKDVGKAIIIITDGENHEDGALEAAQAAAKSGQNIYVIGVGTAQGAGIETNNGVLTDALGQPVHTALNEQMCREVANAGKGIYLHLDQTNSAQEELQNQLSRLKQSSSTTSYTEQDEQFQAVGILALLLLIVEVLMRETQNSLFKRINLLKK